MPLLADDKDSGAKEDQYEFEDGQNSVSKLIHLISSPNSDMWYTLLLKFKKVFLKGGQNRQKYTLPALIFCFFKLSSYLEINGAGSELGANGEEDD
mmetsp:Transcript_9445/g.15914  ORF Transcript_9445/g.15914 Transcript_9445/m.15914 type:complete len:96 (+) Transcript_9445:514-801(+)